MAISLISKEVFDKKQKERKKKVFMNISNLTQLSDSDYDKYDELIIKNMQGKATKKDIIAFEKLKKDLKIRIIAMDVIRVV